MDEYVKDPKKAIERGRVPEIGQRGGIRYRESSSFNPIFIGEVKGEIGIFEINGLYKAYILKDNDTHREIVDVMRDVLYNGGTIFDAIEEGEHYGS